VYTTDVPWRNTVNLVQKLIELDRTTPKRILVVGDGMTDVYIHGLVETNCQEGCAKFVEESRTTVSGGAANAVRSLENWHTKVDYFGACPGSIKTRFMVGNRCVFRHDDDDNVLSGLLDVVRMEAVQAFRRNWYNAVLLSDYDKGTLTSEFIRDVVGWCKNRVIPCVADCKREPDVYRGCVLKCNQEYQHLHNGRLSNLVYDVVNKQQLVVTCGSMNPIAWDSDSPWGLGYDLPNVKCINHVGAGDCFAAHLTLALAHGLSLKDAAAMAHSAGRVYVQYAHNRPPVPEEIAADMNLCQ
jgi:bifunctional ADP-heptose synthase (sugar kinase/adenylyltransferase)